MFMLCYNFLMKIHVNTGGPVATNGYLVVDETTGVAAIVDAPYSTVAPLLNIAAHQHYQITQLLFTHGHWDHVADHQVVTDAYPQAAVLIHQLDEPKLIRPVSLLMALPFVIPSRKASSYLEDGQKLHVGNLEFCVLFTPGHSPGHVAFYCPAEAVLFAGDLLFAGSIGRTDLPDSSPRDMASSLARVLQLPDETSVRSGHGPPTTIGAERQANPWLANL